MTIRSRARRRHPVLFLLAVALCGLAALAVPALAAAETFTVDSTGDQVQQTPGSVICKSTANTCTLRAAIEAADAITSEEEITIAFASTFNGELADTIALGSALPTITVPTVVILGEPSVSGALVPCATGAGKSGPCVGISGPAAGTALTAGATEVQVNGLAFSGSAVGIKGTSGGGRLSARGNWLGTKLDGSSAAVGTGIDVVTEATIEENSIHGGATGIHLTDRTGESGQNSLVKDNVVDSTTGSGILIENDVNQIFGNQISGAGAAGIRVHSSSFTAADENVIGGRTVTPLTPDPAENTIDGSQGPAIEINTVQGAERNFVFRNSGSGNTGAFIKLAKFEESEPKGPNKGVQPPTISAATATAASGNALPESFVRVYAKAATEPGELGAFLGEAETSESGEWSLSYTAPAGTVGVAASQTPERDELGSSALAIKPFQFSLTVTKSGTGSGTVTSAPAGIDCGATCTSLFDAGTLVRLTGTAAGGSNPVAWGGCDAIVGANECQVSLAAAKAVTATFDLTPSSGGGSGGGGSSGSGSTTTPPPTTKPAPKPLQCKKGFKKKKVKGKLRCVKVQKPKHQHH